MKKERNLHRWEELFPQEFQGILEKNPVVYFPFGPVEEHGTHLAMATDFLPVYQMCLEASERTGGVVYPILPAAPAGNPPLSREEMRHKRLKGESLFAPSLFLSVECCRQIYEETLEGMAGTGFKLCIAVGGHMPAIALMESMSKEKKGMVEGMHFKNINWPDIVLSSTDIGRRVPDGLHHGGIIETAMVMHCDRRLCDLKQVMDVYDTNFDSQLAPLSSQDLKSIMNNSTPELGKEIFDSAVSGIVEIVSGSLKKLL